MGPVSSQIPVTPGANALTQSLVQNAAAQARLWSSPSDWNPPNAHAGVMTAVTNDSVWIASSPTPLFVPREPEAPLSLWGKIKRFVRKQTLEKFVINMKEILASPEDSKTKIADAIMIGAVTPYVPIPIPGVGPFLASSAAKIFKRDPALAVSATLYNNFLTTVPILLLQHEVGLAILPANDLPSVSLFGMEFNPAAFAAGTAVMALGTALVARYGTLLVYSRAEKPLRAFMSRSVEKYETAYGPLPSPGPTAFDSLLTHGGKWIIWENDRVRPISHGD